MAWRSNSSQHEWRLNALMRNLFVSGTVSGKLLYRIIDAKIKPVVNHLQSAIVGASARQPHLNDDGPLPSERADRRRRQRWPLITGAIVVLMWVSYFAGVSAMVDLGNPAYTREIYVPRAIVTLVGVIISFAIVAVQFRLTDPTLKRRATLAVIAGVTAPAVQSLINNKTFSFFFPNDSHVFGWPEFGSDYAWRVWIWIATSGMILAMSYAADIRERERRILALENLAHSAQLRALRLQLNPHFLFNALNSVAGLISSKRIKEAEAMTENLADFLRLTLALDPQRLITLEEELQLQRLYLEIEKKRFPDRLLVRVDVPADLRPLLVPSLITQPLIENSVKHAVARSTRPVELVISARSVGNQLELVVADTGSDSAETGKTGVRLGLRNVTERLHTHYGARASLVIESSAGGFCNRILLPMERR